VIAMTTLRPLAPPDLRQCPVTDSAGYCPTGAVNSCDTTHALTCGFATRKGGVPNLSNVIAGDRLELDEIGPVILLPWRQPDPWPDDDDDEQYPSLPTLDELAPDDLVELTTDNGVRQLAVAELLDRLVVRPDGDPAPTKPHTRPGPSPSTDSRRRAWVRDQMRTRLAAGADADQAQAEVFAQRSASLDHWRVTCQGPDCGEVFEATRADARYCSARCRTRARRARGPRTL
jgi:hypothetical protein